MELVLQQKQKLNLKLTPELRQAITILQYSTLDLYDFLKEQEQENPFIELEVREDKLPVSRTKGNRTVNREQHATHPVDFLAAKEACERTKLVEEVNFMELSNQEKEILRYLILNLDGNGYLPMSDEEIAVQLGLSLDETQEAVALLQSMEPAGIGARNLPESLALQIQRFYPEEKTALRIIENHLEDLANRSWKQIADALDITLSEVNEYFHLIRRLNPRPCVLDELEAAYVSPDVIIEEQEGKYDIHLNDTYLPKLTFHRPQTDVLTQDRTISRFVQEHYKSYQTIVSSIEQRKQTMMKITFAILNRQGAFLKDGFAALQPLTLKEIAEEVDLHESTVSRATSNKTIQTPKGTFDFRVFFTTKLHTADGSGTSQAKVKTLLSDYIKTEDKYKPYSDQKIADYFQTKKGITISRRTVAKYREELNIPSSSKRKKIKI